MNFVKTLAVGTFLASTLAASGAFAKAHDQGVKGTFANTEGPANEQTAVAAQTLGERLGDARGFRRLSMNPPPGDAKKDDDEE